MTSRLRGDERCPHRTGIATIWKPPFGQDRSRYCDLTNDERRHLRTINESLTDIERRFQSIALQLCSELDQRVASPTDWLGDYEIELAVDLYLNEAAWEEDDEDDDVFVTLAWDLKGVDAEPDFGFGALHIHHAESIHGDFGDERHCWLYHHLYAHSDLCWRDLLRIGPIGVDLMVDYQAFPWGGAK